MTAHVPEGVGAVTVLSTLQSSKHDQLSDCKAIGT